jgi:hypothetical protein
MALRGLFKRSTAVPLAAAPRAMASVRVNTPGLSQGQSGLRFIEREFETAADDGTALYGRGWVIHDEDDLAVAEADPLLASEQILIFNVAGVTFRPKALQERCFNPGNEVRLIPEPTNPVDKNAIAVWDHARRHHLGYVPKGRTSEIRRGLGASPNARTYVWWDWHKNDCMRCGVKIVVLPAPHSFTRYPDFVLP